MQPRKSPLIIYREQTTSTETDLGITVLQIGMAAVLRFKRDGRSMLLAWQRTAHWQRRCKAVLQQAAGRLKNRSLSLALQEWQYQTWKGRAAQLVQKHSMVAAFNTWKAYHEMHLLERAMAKFTQLSTSKYASLSVAVADADPRSCCAEPQTSVYRPVCEQV